MASETTRAGIADFAVPDGSAPDRVREGPAREPSSAEWSAAELASLAARLAEDGAAALAGVPLDRRLEVWDEAIAAFLDPESEERRGLFAPLVATSRLSPEGLSEALEVVLGGWFGAPARRAAAGAAGHGGGGGAAAVVLSGNVPGLAAQSLLPALVAGRPLLVKSARAEPLFAPALVAALARREPALGRAFAAVTWPGEREDLTRAALQSARTVLAYGGADAVAALRRLLVGRREVRLVTQGPKASVALVARDVDPLGVGRALARDVALLDQRGCLSIQAVFAEGDARELAEALAFGLAIESRRLPPGPIEARELAAVQQWRGSAVLGDALVGRLSPREGTVVLSLDARLRRSPGLRSVRVHAVAEIGDALGPLAAWHGRLQGAAVAGAAAEELTSALEALGVSRVTPPGRLQAADAAWANGGVDPFQVFARGGSSRRAAALTS
jgi:hypothetical protein